MAPQTPHTSRDDMAHVMRFRINFILATAPAEGLTAAGLVAEFRAHGWLAPDIPDTDFVTTILAAFQQRHGRQLDAEARAILGEPARANFRALLGLPADDTTAKVRS